MRKLMKILVGVAMVAPVALVASPAHANHGGSTNDVNVHHPNAGTAYHEDAPVFTDTPIPQALCGVTGSVEIGTYDGTTFTPKPYTQGGPQHDLNLYADPPNPLGPALADLENSLAPPDPKASGGSGGLYNADPITRNLWNNPTHSHYQFQGVVIACVGIGGVEILDVSSIGGNDGHYLDIWNLPPGGTVEIPLVGGGTGSHPHTPHHGSVNESAWSNSDGFSGGRGGANANKGDISADALLANTSRDGWVKYVRVGPYVFAWGTFDPPPIPGVTGLPWPSNFAANLVFTPTETSTFFLLNGAAILY